MADITVQQLLNEVLLDKSDSDDNEMLDLLKFMSDNGVPISNDQAAGMFLLAQYGITDVGNYVMKVRKQMTPRKTFFDFVNKLTLADRIKGNVKLNHVLKANSSPAGLNTEKAMKDPR
ncbi:hypothetical protein MF069_36490 [Paenibacillus mucilaginosus]|uniref:hypothetical protein n=1 Tax=Paenibacillus mucilaginosus TaxID=61624 RepID=UPI001EF026D4|nr:hypothetical protein [Paenibacillus mucilaginosus]MCG7218200.1 hypothetical protein [Paenibacillus mucilaginosus]